LRTTPQNISEFLRILHPFRFQPDRERGAVFVHRSARPAPL
jgi:hypothetical protein